ncbi:MAG: cytochrome c biogenesis protein CcsA, partial [Crocosphaera sp.]|nr:cytochrome c biogenesis protein CcsA [Crocosphaera sp.]
MDLITLENFLDNSSFLLLFLTMLIYWAGAAFRGLTWLPTLGTTGVAIANLCMATLLGARWLEGGYFPLSNLYESLFFLAWGITAIHLLAEQMSRSHLVGVVTTPVAMGITAFAALTLPSEMQTSAPLVPALKSNWLMMHVSVMMLSYATLMVGSVLAIAFLVVTRNQDIQLKGSSVGTGGYRDRLKSNLFKDNQEEPSVNVVQSSGSGGTAVLESVAIESEPITLSPQRLSLADTLDNISYRIIGLGFPLLTIGIIA